MQIYLNGLFAVCCFPLRLVAYLTRSSTILFCAESHEPIRDYLADTTADLLRPNHVNTFYDNYQIMAKKNINSSYSTKLLVSTTSSYELELKKERRIEKDVTLCNL